MCDPTRVSAVREACITVTTIQFSLSLSLSRRMLLLLLLSRRRSLSLTAEFFSTSLHTGRMMKGKREEESVAEEGGGYSIIN